MKIGPSCQKTSPTWTAIPTGPETGGAWPGFETIEATRSARPLRISVNAATVQAAPAASADTMSRPWYSPVKTSCAPRIPRAPFSSATDAGRSVTSTSRTAPSAPSTVSVTVSPALSFSAAMAARPASGLGNRSKVWPSIATIVSPGSRPAASAGEPAWHLGEREAALRRGEPGDPEEDHEREQQVHPDAGDQDDQLLPEALHGERARVVGVAVLAVEADEAADRQPVQGVDRLALRPQDLRARREADPELEDADPEEARHQEVPDLVDHHEAAEDEDEEGDRDRALEDGHALPYAAGPVAVPRAVAGAANAARTSASRATSSSTPGAWSRPGPIACHGLLEKARDAREVERPVQEAGHGHLVGGDQRGRRPRADRARLAGDPQRREAVLVGSPEVEPAGRHEVRRHRPARGAGAGG